MDATSIQSAGIIASRLVSVFSAGSRILPPD
jgi:hypothetical protein